MEREELNLELERLADRFSEGWHEGIKIDASDIILLNEAAQALAQPAQRPWVDLTGNEWFEWWRVSKIADETEEEIDFADFITIALAVLEKFKEKNNG